MLNKFSLIALTLLLTTTLAQAGEENLKSFFYTGQIKEQFELKTKKYETKHREVKYDSTCTEQVPYQKEECGYETHYKTECHTIPGREECTSVPNTVCHTETQQECRTVSDGKRCHDETSQVCTTVNTGRRCHDERICQRVPGGGTRCRTKRVCEPTSERKCRQVSKRVCEDLTKTECRPVNKQVCNTEYSSVCHWVSSHEDCDQVPYQEYECNTVTRYNTRTYSCTKTKQVPYQNLVGDVLAKIDVIFNDSIASEDVKSKIEFTSTLTNDELLLVAKNLSKTKSLIYVEKEISKDDQDKKINISAEYKVKLVDLKTIDEIISNGMYDLTYDKKELRFFVKKIEVPHNFSINLKLTRKTKGLFSKTKKLFNRKLEKSEFEVIKHDDAVEFFVDLETLDINFAESKRSYTVKLGVEVNLEPSNNLLNKEDLPKTKTIEHKQKKKM